MGASLNRILIAANARGLLEVPELRKALEQNREVEVRIVDATRRTDSKTHRTAIRPCGAYIVCFFIILLYFLSIV